jgi:tetratricopeptide (TPR) repeat protein
VLLDETFIKQVRQKLQVDLFARLVDGPAQAAMEAASDLRIPVPSRVLEALAGHESVHHARGNDIIYAVRDRRWGELLTTLGLFRKTAGNDLMPASARDVEDNGAVNHARIAEQLERVYREDDDPKWLRESYYHRMLSGQTEGLSLTEFAGRYYFTELVASAGYCFDHYDYGAALALYDAAFTLGRMDESALMRRASSMIRTGAIKQGSEAYRSLVSDYPKNMGMRRSHVDALLYKGEFEQAKAVLNEYGLLPAENAWHAVQWGRAELGMHNYARAIELFTDLRKQRNDDPFVVTYLARALQQFGDLSHAIRVLQTGANEFKDNVAILTSLANNLERARRDEEARPLLVKLLAEDAGNARAALSMVRILLREENRNDAQRVAKRAEREAHGSIKTFALMALAEVMLADGQPETAADFLRDHLEEDDGVGAFVIDALLRAADEAEDPAERAALVRKAAEVRIPPKMARNVPVQIVLVRLSVAMRDRAAFDAAITNLAGTRIDPAELERQRALW